MFLLLWLLSASCVLGVLVDEAAAQRSGDRSRGRTSDRDGGREGGRDGSRGGGRESRGGQERRGPSTEQIFGYLDRDKNGRLDPQEIENSRGPFKDMLQRAGVDYSRGLDQRNFASAYEKVREQREQESRSRRDGDDDSGRREEYERRRREYEQRREEERKKADSAKRTPTSIAFRAKERVTVDIPQQFVEGDDDGDGQIGFYEWKKWKRDEIHLFAAYDRNGDGFLTPRELEKGPVEIPDASTAIAASTTISGTQQTGATPKTATTSKAETAKSEQPSVDMNTAAARRGESMFRLLDRNRDGQLEEEEWARARTTKPLFEKAGVDLSKPMSKNDFLANYVRLTES
ncbi:EF-hand domain-containing protein [Thalassoglobus polymorphus]|nr:hypothetical protein [Thalassoglobus polymorphus]